MSQTFRVIMAAVILAAGIGSHELLMALPQVMPANRQAGERLDLRRG